MLLYILRIFLVQEYLKVTRQHPLDPDTTPRSNLLNLLLPLRNTGILAIRKLICQIDLQYRQLRILFMRFANSIGQFVPLFIINRWRHIVFCLKANIIFADPHRISLDIPLIKFPRSTTGQTVFPAKQRIRQFLERFLLSAIEFVSKCIPV